MTYEDILKEQLADLQRSYQRAAKPIIDQLAEIESTRLPKPMIIPIADIARGQGWKP